MSRELQYNEREVLYRVADGDEKAFYTFYDHYSEQLRPFLWKYTRSQTDIEDIIQETFIRIWINRDQLIEVENLQGWIFKIAARIYLNYVSKSLAEKKKNCKSCPLYQRNRHIYSFRKS